MHVVMYIVVIAISTVANVTTVVDVCIVIITHAGGLVLRYFFIFLYFLIIAAKNFGDSGCDSPKLLIFWLLVLVNVEILCLLILSRAKFDVSIEIVVKITGISATLFRH